VKKNRVCVSALLAFVTLSSVGAMAEEMTAAPAIVITAPASFLQWTGLYIGANGGYAWSQSGVAYSPNDPAAQAGTCGGVGGGRCIPAIDFGVRGPLAGGLVGFNWQINSMWMTGVEADYQWAHFTGTGMSAFHLGDVGNATMIATQSVTSFGTLRARMGVIPIAPLLLYGTGGLAFGQVGETFNTPSPGAGTLTSGSFSYVCGAAGTTCFAGSPSKMMLGFAVGGGAEMALTTRLTLKTEILYVDLGVPRGTVVAQAAAPGTSPASFSATLAPTGFVVARGGLNFRF
jgi:outer membrane immunogenic protein